MARPKKEQTLKSSMDTLITALAMFEHRFKHPDPNAFPKTHIILSNLDSAIYNFRHHLYKHYSYYRPIYPLNK